MAIGKAIGTCLHSSTKKTQVFTSYTPAITTDNLLWLRFTNLNNIFFSPRSAICFVV